MSKLSEDEKEELVREIIKRLTFRISVEDLEKDIIWIDEKRKEEEQFKTSKRKIFEQIVGSIGAIGLLGLLGWLGNLIIKAFAELLK